MFLTFSSLQDLLWINIGISGVILILLLIRKLFNTKIHSSVFCLIWTFIFIRMLIPYPIESSYALINATKVQLPTAITYDVTSTGVKTQYTPPEYFDEDGEILPDKQAYLDSQPTEYETTTTQKNISFEFIIALIYSLGTLIVLFFIAINNGKFDKYIKDNGKTLGISVLHGNIKTKPINLTLVNGLASPCLIGIFKPQILLNEKSISVDKTKQYTIAHEYMHHKHKDNLWYAIALVACIINWFNPFMWLALHISKKDREIYCDDSVIKQLDDDEKIEYGKALISLIKRKHTNIFALSTAMTGGKKDMKDRIKNIANNKKKWRLVSLISILIIIIGFLLLSVNFGLNFSNSYVYIAEFGEKDIPLTEVEQENIINILNEGDIYRSDLIDVDTDTVLSYYFATKSKNTWYSDWYSSWYRIYKNEDSPLFYIDDVGTDNIYEINSQELDDALVSLSNIYYEKFGVITYNEPFDEQILSHRKYPSTLINYTGEIYEMDINSDGIREYLYNSSAGSGMVHDFIECYDTKTETYSFIEDRGKREFKFIEYDNKLYIYSYQALYLSSLIPTKVYIPLLVNGELDYDEINAELEKEILISLDIYNNHSTDIMNLSLYDYEISEDTPLISFDSSRVDILSMFVNLHESTEPFRDDVGTTHLRIAVIEYNDNRQIAILFGTQGFMTIIDGDKQYNAQNEELEIYLTELIYEYGDYERLDGLSVERFNTLIDTIMSSPKEASSPQAYIAEHKDEYDEIINNMNTMIRDYIQTELSDTSDSPTLRTKTLQTIITGNLESTISDILSIAHNIDDNISRNTLLDYYKYGEKVSSIKIDADTMSTIREFECEYYETTDMFMVPTGESEFYLLGAVKITFAEDKISFTKNGIGYTYNTDSSLQAVLEELFNNE